ncbi:glycosyltransferase family 2 protein [Haloarcula sediminis]|uniref:glycosyltransferase family 2 protein n=1 Tax=Haloarcula sediminis TaxID=3111777 RepID=UPI002D79CDFC|nr:glycosyltransferase family 2 protein [Haloarcula sp. CK38]
MSANSEPSDAKFEVENSDLALEADELLCGPNSEQTPTLSVVMPTLNEESGIRECMERIRTAIVDLGILAEIIISDSSTDRTPDIAREMGAIVVEPDEPGYGYAYRYAFAQARGKYLAMGDADTTYDFEELPKLLNHLHDESADIVMGSRLEGEIKAGAMPNLHQYIGNPLLTKFLNVFYDAGVSDAHSGFRVFTRDALETLDLDSDGMEFASEMIMDASVKDLKISEVPITYHEREGEAKLESFQDGWRHVKFMLINAPSYLFSVPGLAMCGVGLFLMAFSLTGQSIQVIPTVRQPTIPGIRSMVTGSLLMIVGYQIASKGLFTTVAGDPIRRPDDPITNVIVEHLSLERGAAIGLMILGSGVAYAAYLLSQWWFIGYEALPALTHDIAAFTAIVIGVQTMFGAFFISAVADR